MSTDTKTAAPKPLTVTIEGAGDRLTVPFACDDLDDARAARVRELITARTGLARWQAQHGEIAHDRARLCGYEVDAIETALIALGAVKG